MNGDSDESGDEADAEVSDSESESDSEEAKESPDEGPIHNHHAGHAEAGGHWQHDAFELRWVPIPVNHRDWEPESPPDSGMSDRESNE